MGSDSYVLESVFYTALCGARTPRPAGFREAVRTIIRFLTFSEMGLAHTCCQTAYCGLLRARHRDEVKEIREEKRFLLDELEELVAEFESKYDELGVPLSRFLEDY